MRPDLVQEAPTAHRDRLLSMLDDQTGAKSRPCSRTARTTPAG